MLRCLITLLYALMLFGIGLPAAGQSSNCVSELVTPAAQLLDEAALADPEDHGLALVDHLQTDTPVEIPELFDGLRFAAPKQAASAAPLCGDPAPPSSPYLEGPQRPPQQA